MDGGIGIMSPAVGQAYSNSGVQTRGQSLRPATSTFTAIGRLRLSVADGEAQPVSDALDPASRAKTEQAKRTGSPSASEASEKNAQSASALRYSQDRDLNRWVLKLVDPATQEVIRQIPPEAILDMARQLRSMGKSESGNLFDQYS